MGWAKPVPQVNQRERENHMELAKAINKHINPSSPEDHFQAIIRNLVFSNLTKEQAKKVLEKAAREIEQVSDQIFRREG